MEPESNPTQPQPVLTPENSQVLNVQPPKKKRKFIWIILLLVFTFIIPVIPATIFLIIYLFIARPFQVSGKSMSPNFIANQDYIVSRFSYAFAAPARGDVVVFISPVDTNKDLIKRIIGLPNDIVSLQDGEVFINSQPIDETSYLNADKSTRGGAFLKEGHQVTTPEGSYFVLGDNRPYSSDSREWGFVRKKDIIGKIMFCYSQCEVSKK